MKHRADTATAGKSVRLLKIGEEIRHILSGILMRGDVHDDVLAKHSITVTEVRVSPDIRHATVFFEPLGGFDEEAVLAALKKASRYLKGEVGHKLKTRYVPELHFQLDHSFDEATHIETLLRAPKVKQDLG
jgi:ribosome-binding factor A